MGKNYADLELQLNEPIEVFQAQMFSLTGVPPERQKLMYKGIMLNNTDPRKARITNGAKIMMIGTAEKLVESAQKVKLFEDMSPEEQAELIKSEKVKPPPAGIMNLGNTCYFNAVFQFLRPVKELWDAIGEMEEKEDVNKTTENYYFIKMLLDMRNQLPTMLNRYMPLPQITLLRRINPLFSRKDEKTGVYMQQDAEECLSCILTSIDGLGDLKVVDEIFGYDLEAKTKPKEVIEGAPADGLETAVHERQVKLNCYMGTQLKSVGTIMDGIMLALNEEVEKFCEGVGQNIVHEKVGRISAPPKYLVVHLVRFEWKQESVVSKTEAVKAKVCRRVLFERTFDITPICTEELKPLLNAGNAKAMKSDFGVKAGEAEAFKGYELYPGEYATGRYELQSIVTHQGRSADGGHYICWAKDTRKADEASEDKKAAEDRWLMYDDDHVTEVPWGSFDLSGGRSDYHIAVLLLYKAQCVRLEQPTEEPMASPEES